MHFSSCAKDLIHCLARTLIETNTLSPKTGYSKQLNKPQLIKHLPRRLVPTGDLNRQPLTKKCKVYNIATLNTRTLWTHESLLELENALQNIKFDILGISEMRKHEEKIEYTDYILYQKGKTAGMSPMLDEQQQVEQAGFRKSLSTIDHIHTVKQILEKYNEYNKKASIQLETLGKDFPIKRGVRQGDPLSPKLFSAVLENIFRNLNWEGFGLNINGSSKIGDGPGHMMRDKRGKWCKAVSEWYPRDGKRSRGRQCIRWEDNIKMTAGPRWRRSYWTRLIDIAMPSARDSSTCGVRSDSLGTGRHERFRCGSVPLGDIGALVNGTMEAWYYVSYTTATLACRVVGEVRELDACLRSRNVVLNTEYSSGESVEP
ncbi:hypothetical protein EVAR_75932_1 [Eumeta japonica]|uniref:Uncharacterized protein n=1 Tax=Eumeta variegata TaxID=151549 RepID=A0A4C1UWA0_EUMVA|nr:hypothetical protein EVAR_75932_1 [Eumeta japonica]